MREYAIGREAAGKRLDKWLLAELPLLPLGLAQKYIRLKRVKINGKAAQRDARLAQGDLIQLYIGDEFFGRPKAVDPLLSAFHHNVRVVYEDENILLADKRPGLIVHPDEREKLNTLVTHVRAYLYQKGEWDSQDKAQFAPVPCNRIDRFTGGIVIFAKNEAAMRAMNAKIREHEVEKGYLCIALGTMRPPEGLLEGYIAKQPAHSRVRVLSHPEPGAQRALTRYRTLAQADGLSLLRCELVTGRTHQIRAQFAAAGHPLLGDGQYGDARQNQRYGREFQALYADQIAFRFQSDAGVLNGLNGKRFRAVDVPFVRAYFPDFVEPIEHT